MRKETFLLLFILYCCAVNAQQPFQNNGNLRLHAGAALVCYGSMTNSSAAVLINNGDLYVKGYLTNDELAMSAGTGTLYLNGAAAQALNGTQVFKTNNLVTDNSSGITLNNDLSVGGAHTYTTGFIHSSATPNYLIYEAGSSHSGSNDSRHSTGWVKKNGNTDFTFPVGDNTYLRTVALSGISVSSEFNCHYYIPTQNTYNLNTGIVKVKNNEYWQVDKVSGGSAQVTLNWDHAKVPMDNIALSDIVAGHYTGGLWSDGGGTATGNVTTTGTVTSGSISSFSPFTLAYRSFPIPLKLLSFTGWRRSGITYLHWVTESEQDVKRFSIQRSFDGNTFTEIGSVNARNRGIRELYNFEDPAPFTGTAYYRLSSIDMDGTFNFSRVIAVSESSNDHSTFTLLNPVRTAITIFNRYGTGGVYDYRLYNSAGQMILKGSISLGSNAAAMIRLPLQIPYGIYSLELLNDKTRFTQQILVER